MVQPRRGWLDDRWAERHKRSLPPSIDAHVVETPWDPPTDADYCVVAPHSGEWSEGSVEEMCLYAWDGTDVLYPRVVWRENGRFTAAFTADEFSKPRVRVEDWMPRSFLIRTSLLRGHTNWWDMWKSLSETARFKACLPAVFVDDAQPWRIDTDPHGGLDLNATFYCQASPATTYLRCILPSRVVNGQVSPSILMHETTDDFSFPTHRGGTAVMQFAGDKTWAGMALGMQHKGVRVLVETDDNYTVTSGKIQRRAGWGTRIGEARHTLDGHMWIVKNACDGLIVTSEALARTYRKFGKPVFVCPNQIDPADWQTVERPDRPFTIGWFASLSHTDDAKLVERAMEWAARQPGVQVRTMGLNPTWWKMSRHHVPWVTDLAVYRRAMFDLDVGLAPVVPTAWSVCRSDVKALEYTMGGAACVLSDQPPYEWWHGRPALMAKTAKDFLHHVKWLVGNQDEARAMAAEAKKVVLKERTIQANAHLWRQAIDG